MMQIFVRKSPVHGLPITYTKSPKFGGALIDHQHMLHCRHMHIPIGRRCVFKGSDSKNVARHIVNAQPVGSELADLLLLKLDEPLDKDNFDILNISPLEVGQEVIINRRLKKRRPFITRISAIEDNILFASAGDDKKSMIVQGDSGMSWLVKHDNGDYGIASVTSRIWCGVGPYLWGMRDEIDQVKKIMAS